MFSAWPVGVVETERRRLEVLRYLTVVPGYEAAAIILRERCREIGVPSTDDQILACFEWLREQELVTVRFAHDAPIARITPQGRETAQGFRHHPGVMRPDP